MASTLLAGTLVGFILTCADNLRVSRTTEQAATAILLAETEMEKVKAAWAHNYSIDPTAWSSVLGQGYLIARSVTNIGSGTRKRITLQVGYDQDGDNGLDTNEIILVLTTAYAQRDAS